MHNQQMSAATRREHDQPENELQHLATAIRLSGEAILVIDSDGTIRNVNEAALTFFGRRNLDELIGKNLVDFLLPEDRAGVLTNVHKRLAGELIGNLEFELVLATGEQRWGELNPTILNNAVGQAVGSIVVLRDITIRRHSEAQLHYRIVIERAVAEVSRIFATTMSPNLREILQILGTAVGTNRAHIFRLHEDRRTLDNTHEWCDEHTTPIIANWQGVDSALAHEVMALLTRGESFVLSDVSAHPHGLSPFQEILATQGIRALINVPLRSLDGTLLGFIGFNDTKRTREWSMEDVRLLHVAGEMLVNAWTRQQVEDALRRSQERFTLIARGTNDGLWDRDLITNETYLSVAYKEQLGYEDHELANAFASFEARLHPEDHDHVLEAIQEHLRHRTPFRTEFRLRVKSGEYRWFESYGQGLWNEAGQPIRMAGSLRDITIRKEAREHLERQVKERTAELARTNATLATHIQELKTVNQELESLTYTIAHDLRAPIRHVHGFVSLLEKRLPDLDAKGKHYLTVIADAVKQMGEQIDALLTFVWTGRREIQHTRVAFGRLVSQVLQEEQHKTADREILWDIGPLPDVQGDPEMLRLVLTHLLDNAVKYTRSRPSARITIDCASVTAHEAVWFIRDNGIGFDMQYAHTIFDVFHRLHHTEEFEGAGIGLPLVRRIIQRHGGRIWVDAAVERTVSHNKMDI